MIKLPAETVVSAGSKRSRTVSAEAKYDGQFLQEAKIQRNRLYPVVIGVHPKRKKYLSRTNSYL